MPDLVALDARRTKNSIIVYVLLTAALSSIFYVLRAGQTQRSDLLVLGQMWCPGVSGLLTRLAFQSNVRGLGLGWGRTKFQFASYWIPLVYSGIVYVPVWLGGYYDSTNNSIAALAHRFPHLPHAILPLILFLSLTGSRMLGQCFFALGEELGWRGLLVPQLAKITSYPRVALISGFIWAIWHYPAILLANYHGASPRWYSIVCFTVMVLGISFPFAWMRLKSGSVWTGMIMHASHNFFVHDFFDGQTRRVRITDLWTTEFGAGLALTALGVAIIFYAKRGELPPTRERERGDGTTEGRSPISHLTGQVPCTQINFGD